jgi:hypothetical protein
MVKSSSTHVLDNVGFAADDDRSNELPDLESGQERERSLASAAVLQ